MRAQHLMTITDHQTSSQLTRTNNTCMHAYKPVNSATANQRCS
uniref:Uncharacterized protein n=1 Tax=Arundo donax TaxID=35708 RepID=A0A0A9BXE3_ARUDO